MSLKDSLEIIARDIDVLDSRINALESVEQVFTIYAGEVVINEAGVDVDLRIEGSTDPNLLFINMGSDRIGIGTNTPEGRLTMFTDDGDQDFRMINDGSYNYFYSRNYSNVASQGCFTYALRSRGTLAIPAAIQSGDNIYTFAARGYNGAAFTSDRGGFKFVATENWNAAANGTALYIYATSNGAIVLHRTAVFQNGVQVGAPAGGDKGIGTINVSVDIYKNNVAYVNPDYVLERHYRGKIEKFIDNLGAEGYEGLMSLLDVDKFMDDNLHLPQIHREPMGIFDRSDVVLLHLEQIYLYLIEHEKRLIEVEHGD